MANATKTTELLLTCPECGATCGFTINTADMSTVECSECNMAIDPRDAAEQLRDASAKWESFGEWLAKAAMV
jgi:hypothetical protein